MSHPRVALALTLAVATIAAPSPARADANAQPPSPANLRVSGGEQAWHPDNDFRLDWDASPEEPNPPVVAYRVLDAANHIVAGAQHLPGELHAIEHIHLPFVPGIYTAEVWFEGPGGLAGPAASAALRFDDRPPGPARPLAPPGWLPAGSPAVLRIEHPPAPLPVSGIRGYAISVDGGGGSAPCQGPAGCAFAETDLRGGIEDDTTSLGPLPEGISFARVVAVSGSGMRSPVIESTALRVDLSAPDVVLRGLPSGWANGPVRVSAAATDRLSGMDAHGPAGPFTAIAVDGGAATTAAGDTVAATVHGDGAHLVAFYARDAAGNVADGQADSPQPSLAVVHIDGTAPRLAFANPDPSDPERIEATVADPLSGPDPSWGTIAIRPAGSGRPFVPLPTIASAGRLAARWDSDAHPPGSYEFRATAHDLAGNAGEGNRRADGARMVLANPVKQLTGVVSGFAGNRGTSRSRSVPYGRGTWFEGRLSSSAAPVGGVPVAVVETFAPGSRPARRATTVRTDEAGAFRAHLDPGPSRQVEAVFGGTSRLTKSTSPPTKLDARGAVRLRTSASSARVGGAAVVFSGRVAHLGAPMPAEGRAVELQFRVGAGAWREFRTVRTDVGGRFRLPYVFSDDDSRGVRFQFRAHVPAQQGWPYAPGASRPVAVTGR